MLAAEPAPAVSEEPAGFTPPTPEEEEIAAAQVPGAQEVSKALGEYERQEREREEWLKTPEAVKQREESRLGFADFSPSESEELLRTAFSRQLEALNSDPSRFLSDAKLVRTLGHSGAVVEDEGGGSLLETTVPVRAEDEEGKLAKVDLSLEASTGGFKTTNAVTDLRLPGSAEQGMDVGKEGFRISQAGAAASPARRYGDKNLFYPSALPDTDLLASATSFGLELYDLLRSEDSPEDLRFQIEVPDGAELRSDGRGGAEVLREGERLTLIPKPSAEDAQGTDVPIRSEVEGNSLVVHIAHRAATTHTRSCWTRLSRTGSTRARTGTAATTGARSQTAPGSGPPTTPASITTSAAGKAHTQACSPLPNRSTSAPNSSASGPTAPPTNTSTSPISGSSPSTAPTAAAVFPTNPTTTLVCGTPDRKPGARSGSTTPRPTATSPATVTGRR
ncbi:MAG TPA: hypothetical protein VFN89_12820 [Solirubrobacterales bacterium]|nr:hypothetical protein [Solirubrobacterales bacterium]